MSVTLDTPSPPLSDRDPPPDAAPRRPVWWLVGALAAAWLVPVVTHVVGVDLVLPGLIWLGTAALLRSGRTLVDRLALAAATLTGAVAVFGVLFSVWPWGLH